MLWGPVLVIVAVTAAAVLLPRIRRSRAKVPDHAVHQTTRLDFFHPRLDQLDFYVDMASDETAAAANGWAGNEPAVIRARFANPDEFERFRASDLVAVDRSNGKLVGTATFAPAPVDPKHARMIGIHVHPDHRGQGFAREIMGGAIMLMHTRWTGPLLVGTHIDNVAMQRVMRQLGYEAEPQTQTYTAPDGNQYESYWYRCDIDLTTKPTGG